MHDYPPKSHDERPFEGLACSQAFNYFPLSLTNFKNEGLTESQAFMMRLGRTSWKYDLSSRFFSIP